MIFDWYKVINKTEFEATQLVQQTVNLVLEDLGSKEVLVTQGNLFSIVVDGVMLSVGLTSANPFIFDDRAVYLNPVTQDVYYGILVA